MLNSHWKKYNNQAVDYSCEIVFIDQNNQICQGTVKKLPVNGSETVLAFRELTVKPPTIEKTFVAYWNWKTGKFWPFKAKTPPNPKLPYYFRIEIPFSNPNEFRYFIHSQVIA